MTLSRSLFALLAASVLFACKTDEVKDDLGNVEFSAYSFHVEQEGDWAPGTSTNYAIKANPGTPKPDQVSCYYGEAASSFTSTSPVVIANYDSGDDDFDCTYMTPADPLGDSRLFIQVSIGGSNYEASTNVAK